MRQKCNIRVVGKKEECERRRDGGSINFSGPYSTIELPRDEEAPAVAISYSSYSGYSEHTAR